MNIVLDNIFHTLLKKCAFLFKILKKEKLKKIVKIFNKKKRTK